MWNLFLQTENCVVLPERGLRCYVENETSYCMMQDLQVLVMTKNGG